MRSVELVTNPAKAAAFSRRDFLRTAGGAAAGALSFFGFNSRATAQNLADPYAATLEASIKEAKAKGIKFDYGGLQKHPSSLCQPLDLGNHFLKLNNYC